MKIWILLLCAAVFSSEEQEDIVNGGRYFHPTDVVEPKKDGWSKGAIAKKAVLVLGVALACQQLYCLYMYSNSPAAQKQWNNRSNGISRRSESDPPAIYIAYQIGGFVSASALQNFWYTFWPKHGCGNPFSSNYDKNVTHDDDSCRCDVRTMNQLCTNTCNGVELFAFEKLLKGDGMSDDMKINLGIAGMLFDRSSVEFGKTSIGLKKALENFAYNLNGTCKLPSSFDEKDWKKLTKAICHEIFEKGDDQTTVLDWKESHRCGFDKDEKQTKSNNRLILFHNEVAETKDVLCGRHKEECSPPYDYCKCSDNDDSDCHCQIRGFGPCDDDEDCPTGFCSKSRQCLTPVGSKSKCKFNYQCTSNNCVTNEYARGFLYRGFCENCKSKEDCDYKGSICVDGKCKNSNYDYKGKKDLCQDNSQCQSNFCNEREYGLGVCANIKKSGKK